MGTPRQTKAYATITGRRLSISKLNKEEKAFMIVVLHKYKTRPGWTHFAAWWNAAFKATRLNARSVAYRICEDLEARLGIAEGTVSPPDYRDFLADLIEGQFGSRQEFCKKTDIDPGQLSRVLAGRADLSIKTLQTVLQVLHAKLVVDTEEREQTSYVAEGLNLLDSSLGDIIE